MTDPLQIRIADYLYELPDDRIAQFPLDQRDSSKLLIYREGEITDDQFTNLGNHLTADSTLVFNDTRVIRARILFEKPTGSKIEIFCLEPLEPARELQRAFSLPSGVVWTCLIGNLKRWKQGKLERKITAGPHQVSLTAERIHGEEDGSFRVMFRWSPPEIPFSQVLDGAGQVPLPPYIHRDPEQSDSNRYQTIYARHDGSVAAPTAGLHFTDNLTTALQQKGISLLKLTLHVGIGTFKPVTAPLISGHEMHQEHFIIPKETIRRLYLQYGRPIIAVGTTSARTLESLYWFGVRLYHEKELKDHHLLQWEPYSSRLEACDPLKALEAVLTYLETRQLGYFAGATSLMIVPGYQFRMIGGLITNFHMPGSTLLLLISALIGKEWSRVYKHAMDNSYRFLSYGDSCLFFNSGRF